MKTGTVKKMSGQDFMAGLDDSLGGAYRCTRAALKLLAQGDGGSVINIASMYGIVSPDPGIYGASGQNNPPQYGAAKAGIIQLTRYLAVHLAKDHIRVNAISPGAFPQQSVLEDKEFRARLEDKIPLGRVGRPEELIGAVVYLASPAGKYVTGSNLVVDGGWSAW